MIKSYHLLLLKEKKFHLLLEERKKFLSQTFLQQIKINDIHACLIGVFGAFCDAVKISIIIHEIQGSLPVKAHQKSRLLKCFFIAYKFNFL